MCDTWPLYVTRDRCAWYSTVVFDTSLLSLNKRLLSLYESNHCTVRSFLITIENMLKGCAVLHIYCSIDRNDALFAATPAALISGNKRIAPHGYCSTHRKDAYFFKTAAPWNQRVDGVSRPMTTAACTESNFTMLPLQWMMTKRHQINDGARNICADGFRETLYDLLCFVYISDIRNYVADPQLMHSSHWKSFVRQALCQIEGVCRAEDVNQAEALALQGWSHALCCISYAFLDDQAIRYYKIRSRSSSVKPLADLHWIPHKSMIVLDPTFGSCLISEYIWPYSIHDHVYFELMRIRWICEAK